MIPSPLPATLSTCVMFSFLRNSVLIAALNPPRNNLPWFLTESLSNIKVGVVVPFCVCSTACKREIINYWGPTKTKISL